MTFPVDIANIKKLTRNVEGWLTEGQAVALYRLARAAAGRGAIVEIGSWKGRSTIWLAMGSRQGRGTPVVAIDPHTGASEQKARADAVWTFDEFQANLKHAGVDDLVRPIVATSEEAARGFDEPIELIFIDGAHEYELVKLDFELWFPKVIDGGTMAFHDTIGREGPRRVVEEKVFRSRRFRNVRFVDSMTVAEKVADNTAADRLRNRYVLLVKDMYDVGYRAYQRAGIQLPPALRSGVKRVLQALQ
jgi:predicted O-methyltransferase YrrM